jgi:DNA-binding protein Fis
MNQSPWDTQTDKGSALPKSVKLLRDSVKKNLQKLAAKLTGKPAKDLAKFLEMLSQDP